MDGCICLQPGYMHLYCALPQVCAQVASSPYCHLHSCIGTPNERHLTQVYSEVFYEFLRSVASCTAEGVSA